MNYFLPTRVEVGGTEYEIRADFRAALDMCAALSDPALNDQERAFCAMTIFYPALDDMPAEDYDEAIQKLCWFINCGDADTGKKQVRLMDWDQDFPYIVSAINRVAGQEVRAVPYDFENNLGGLHWWTFIGYYREVGGDCTFAQIVQIRAKLKQHKRLDKAEQEFYRKNREMVDFKERYTDDEEEFLKSL